MRFGEPESVKGQLTAVLSNATVFGVDLYEAGLADKVEGFLDDMSSRMNDGVLVLVGDMDEERLKKLLSEYAGGFRTQDVAFRRPVVRYQPVSG